MYLVDKVLHSRETLRELLSDDWDITPIQNLSREEIEIMYKASNASSHESTGCNIVLNHLYIDGHRLHIFYYNFPELNRTGTKINKTCCEKITALYKHDDTDELPLERDDSVLMIINEPVSASISDSVENTFINNQDILQKYGLRESISKQIKDKKLNLTIQHFRNIHIFHVDRLIHNVTKHELVPKHTAFRDRKMIDSLMKKMNITVNQLPVILRTDPIAKCLRLAPGDICEIQRKSNKSGITLYYRLCK